MQSSIHQFLFSHRIWSLLGLWFITMHAVWGAEQEDGNYKNEYTKESISLLLAHDGFENVRVELSDQHKIRIALEDNHYSGIYTGLAKALKIIASECEEADNVEIIALRDQIPALTIKARKTNGTWNVYESDYGGEIGKSLKKEKTKNSSFGHIDVVAYPEIEYSNSRLDRFWCVALWFSPAIQFTLWPGGKFVAQARLLLYDNFPSGYDYYLLPGYITLDQQIVSTHYWDIHASLGLFSSNRNGLDIRTKFHVNRYIDLGMIFSATGPYYMDGSIPTLCNWDKFNVLAQFNIYEPNSRVQVDVKAGKFLYGYKGARLDAFRHFHDRAVGVFVESSSYCTNVGFQFSLPIGSKKLGKRRALRLRLPEAISFSYGDAIHGQKNYNNHGTCIYKTSPSQPYTTDYVQPEMIRRYVQEEVNKDD